MDTDDIFFSGELWAFPLDWDSLAGGDSLQPGATAPDPVPPAKRASPLLRSDATQTLDGPVPLRCLKVDHPPGCTRCVSLLLRAAAHAVAPRIARLRQPSPTLRTFLATSPDS